MDRATIGGGILLEYDVTGSGESVATIHGALVSDAFLPLLPEPALRGFGIVTYRRRGYGGSTPTLPSLSIAEQAADCRGLLRNLGIDRCHVIGHSFGGAVALQMALDFPDEVRSLVLLEPALMLGASGPEYRESLKQAIRRFQQEDTALLVNGFMEARWPGYRTHLDKVLPGAFEQAVIDARTTFEVDLPGLLDWGFSERDASRVDLPVLSVVGSESKRLSPRFAEVHEWLLTSLPNVEGFVLPNAHHFLQIEKPQRLTEALAAFFKLNPLLT